MSYKINMYSKAEFFKMSTAVYTEYDEELFAAKSIKSSLVILC